MNLTAGEPLLLVGDHREGAHSDHLQVCVKQTENTPDEGSLAKIGVL